VGFDAASAVFGFLDVIAIGSQAKFPSPAGWLYLRIEERIWRGG